jgi:ADP-ribose pyrophosphatase
MEKVPLVRLSRRTAYRTPWLRVEEHGLRLRATGRRITYSFVVTAPSVQVVAVNPSGRILIVRQYRYPTKCWNYELPGGGTGKLRPVQAARKELEDETGWRAGRLRKAGDFVVYCGLASEISHVFVATGLQRGRQDLEDTEHLTVHEVTWRQLTGMIRRGEFRDGMGLAALTLAQAELRKIGVC